MIIRDYSIRDAVHLLVRCHALQARLPGGQGPVTDAPEPTRDATLSDDVQRRVAIERYLAGDTLAEAGKAVGVSGPTVRLWMVAAGIARRTRGTWGTGQRLRAAAQRENTGDGGTA
jgi:hypothetical protein